MNKEYVELRIKYNKLIEENKILRGHNVSLSSELKTTYRQIDDRIDKRVKQVTTELKKEINEKDKIIDALKLEIAKLESKLSNDSTNSGIPTSKTKIGDKKYIPNTREKSDKNIGGQKGHKKHKLAKFEDSEINEVVEVTPKECNKCHSTNIEVLDSSVDKDETDYEVKVIKRRHKFKNCQCKDCHNIFHVNIPNSLKEENQYGTMVQSLAVCLTNEVYTPFNKVVKLISGITEGEINMSEGYVVKLQKRAYKKLESFTEELKEKIRTSPVYGWDDGVIDINTEQGILRTYCTDKLVLFKAHEKKDEKSLDEDGILQGTSKDTIVMHDHLIHNYNEKYRFENVECLIHLIRRLRKMHNNTNHNWLKELIELLSQVNTNRNELIKKNIESFNQEYLDEISKKYDELLEKGRIENKKEGNYFLEDEQTLIKDLAKYKKSYLLWMYRFDIPSTNNNSERSLRPVKSKLKISGMFKSIDYARYYATIRSYIETCKRYKINIIHACERLMSGNPYTLDEIIAEKNSK